MNNRIITSLCVLCAFLCAVQRASAQGSLTPPGPPAPTMLTLSQVEPRTPITNATAVTISASGSYYLTANITVGTGNAITITASGVTLDLNGFTISSTNANAAGKGIQLAAGQTDITILNGHIKGSVTNSGGTFTGNGFADGINYASPAPSNVRVSGVSVSGCGNNGVFLSINNSTVVESCTVNSVGGAGIVATTVTHSMAYQCGNTAIQANTASDCYGYSISGDGLDATSANNCIGISNSNGSGDGLDVVSANNCSGVSNGGGGVVAYIANNCYGQSVQTEGLYALVAIGCYGQSDDANGLYASIANSCYGANGLIGTIANSCYSSSGDGGIEYTYNMP